MRMPVPGIACRRDACAGPVHAGMSALPTLGVDAALVVVWRVRVVCRRAGVLVRVSVACGVQALCAALRVRLPSFDGVFGRRDRMRLLVVVCGVWDTGEGHAVDVRSADCRERCACVRCK